ncbi:hypothetical protein [Vibrio breoganii]|uniref:hypothetical protein n=1 Tax=Vibrio breoganii TaxID=553239 RepID=UPI000C822877|nr:hypothetical protein [Vibrio breoganii]PMK33052.1 hypothetical protein BCU03_04665 [Vibrio breoganii]
MSKTKGSFTSETAVRNGRPKGALNKKTTLRKVLVTTDIATARQGLREILESKGHPDYYKACEMVYKLGVQAEIEEKKSIGKKDLKRMHALRVTEIKAKIIQILQSIHQSSPQVSVEGLNNLIDEVNAI